MKGRAPPLGWVERGGDDNERKREKEPWGKRMNECSRKK